MVQALPVTRLQVTDVDDNVALARSVGWHDAEGDWRVIHEAASVIGMRQDGRLVAQGALGLYGNYGTIAKMIVAPQFQRQGAGARLLDVLLEEATARSISVLGLVATDFGKPLYERNSFSCVGEVVVLTGTPNAVELRRSLPPLDDADAAIRVEERWIGRFRATMLRARFMEAAATSLASGSSNEPCGYAMATMQGPHALVGPVIAETEDEARSLVETVFCATGGPVRIDVPAEQGAFRGWLQALGLQEQGARAEMAFGATRLPWQVPQRYALAAQAWGRKSAALLAPIR